MNTREMRQGSLYDCTDGIKRKLMRVSGVWCWCVRTGEGRSRKLKLADFAAMATQDVTRPPLVGAVPARK